VCVCAYRRRAQRRPKFCTAWPAVVLLSLPVSAGSQLQLLQLCGDGAQPHRLAGLVQRPQVVPLHLMQLKGACGEAAPALGANAGASLRQGQAHSWAAASLTAPPVPSWSLGSCRRWTIARRPTRPTPASRLVYADPADANAYRWLKDTSLSTPTHLVLYLAAGELNAGGQGGDDGDC